MNVDDAEVLFEAVPEEDTAKVEEEPELFVGSFEGDEVVGRGAGVEVAGYDAGVGG